jgi:hypothetical protein
MRTDKKPQQNVLPADEATVEERQVTIQVLTLGKKQVTQALYRQLLEQDLINPYTGLLKGTPWGWVNLHIDCDEKQNHLHVVWEDNGLLKRSCVYASFQASSHYQRIRRNMRALTYVYATLAALEERRLVHYDEEKLYMNVNGYAYNISLADEIRKLWDLPKEIAEAKKLLADAESGALMQEDETRRFEYEVKAAREFLQGIRQHIEALKDKIRYYYSGTVHSVDDKDITLNTYASSLDVYAEIERLCKELSALENNWKTSFATIEQQGQLFIAVSGVWK